jgi:hypothetical protein
MTTQEFLFSFTFVFGVLYLLSYTKLFTKNFETFTEALVYCKLQPFWTLVGYWIFYSSLFYQSLFWAKFLNIIK